MEKEEFEHEYIVASTSFAETDDEKILEARRRYTELYDNFKKEVDKEAEVVKNAGGLCIIGTERHESRRIDNQLRGRAGRQGDPGESCFYVSFEDDLLRLFAGDRLAMISERFNIPEDQPIEAKIHRKRAEES